MPGIVRVGLDMNVSHCHPFAGCHQTPYATGSPNVRINGAAAVRVGDVTSCGDVAVDGSPNILINGKPVHRMGDATSGHAGWAPSIAETGSSNVFANGK